MGVVAGVSTSHNCCSILFDVEDIVLDLILNQILMEQYRTLAKIQLDIHKAEIEKKKFEASVAANKVQMEFQKKLHKQQENQMHVSDCKVLEDKEGNLIRLSVSNNGPMFNMDIDGLGECEFSLEDAKTLGLSIIAVVNGHMSKEK